MKTFIIKWSTCCLVLVALMALNPVYAADFENSYPDCTAPTELSVELRGEHQAVFSWKGEKPSRKSHYYSIRYKTSDRQEWQVFEENNKTSFKVSGIVADLDYRFEVQKVCYANDLDSDYFSDWVGVDLIAEEGRNNSDSLCAFLTYSEAQPYESGIMVNWEGPTAEPGSVTYKISFKRSGTLIWQDILISNGDQYYIGDLQDQVNYDVRIELMLAIENVVCEPQELGPIFIEHAHPEEPEEEDDPEITLPEFTCGEDYVLDPISNQIPLAYADTGDIFFIGGFPILLKIIEGGSGTFSGTGLVPLPFSEKTVLVEFVGVSVNDEYVIYEGQVSAVASNIPDYPSIPDEPFYVGDDICQPMTDSIGWDENGLYQPGDSPVDPQGFGPGGTYAQEPPYPGYQPGDPFDDNYDPNGYDDDGNHVETGGPYNPVGCNQVGLDADGQPCDNTGGGPYYWLDPEGNPPTGGGITLADSIANDLRDLIVQSLDSLQTEARDSLESNIPRCAEIKTEIDNTLTAFNEISIVEGQNGEYTSQGMHQQFSQVPKALPNTTNTRDPKVISLEKRHVDLYNCDLRLHKFIYWEQIIINAHAAEEIDRCESDLIEVIKRLPDAQAELLLNDPAALLSWIYNRVDIKMYNDLLVTHGDQYGYEEELEKAFKLNSNLKTPSFSSNSSNISTAGNLLSINDFSQAALDEFQFKFNQGHDYINGTHRAFFLEYMAKQNSFAMGPYDQHKTPIELSKVVAGKEQVMYLENIVFTTQGATFDVVFILETPNNGNKAVFELKNIGFGPTGIPAGVNPRLQLVSDIGIRISNAARLNILGGENTYVAFDCEGFAGMSVEADIEFCRNYLTPLDPVTMEIIADEEERVRAHFIAEMPAWGEFIAELNFTPFELTNVPDTKFTVQSAVLDLSDSQTFEGIVFPDNYVSPFVVNGGVSHQWKGFYLRQLSVTLPNQFKQGEGDGEPITGSVNDVIIDGMGFSGRVALSPVLSLENGNVGGWAFAIDEFELGIVANRISSGKLTGLINVPLLSSKENNTDEITEADCLPYVGMIDAGNKYSFSVFPNQAYQAKLWKANIQLDTCSSISLNLEEGDFYAKAELHGKISIDSSFSDNLKVKIPTVSFNGLTIQSRVPYLDSIGTWGAPTEIDASFGGFGISITTPRAFKRGDNEAGFNLGAMLRLNDNENEPQNSDKPGLSAGGNFSIIGEVVTENDRQKWRYKEFEVNEFCIEAGNMGGIKKLDGCLAFFKESDWNGNTNWGSGFRGYLGAELELGKLNLNLEVVGQFGNIRTGNDPFKYFMVDGMMMNEDGIDLGPLALHGFGGGLTYNMERQSILDGLPDEAPDTGGIPEIGTSLSGTLFLPNSEKSVGVFANVVMATTKKEAFNFNATLGAEFQDGGGLSSMYFQGNARFMSEMELSARCNYDPSGGIPDNGVAVNAYINLEMDFNSGIFDGRFDVFVNAAEGAIVGYKDPATKKFGGCEMSFGHPDGWYINMGKPSARNILRVSIPGLPNTGVDFTSYLNIGTDLEPMPDPPLNIQQMLGVGNFMADESRRATGNGFAFGASLGLDTGPLEFWIFYARLQAGLGFDFNLQDYGSSTLCQNTGKAIGINGWYASGQAYAYFEGEIGIKVKLFGQHHEYPIISLGAAAILQAKLPNPFWAQATVGGYYNILGGLVKGECTFKVELGEACQLEDGVELNPTFPIYSSISPGKNESGVSTFINPEVFFGMPIGEEFEEEGESFELVLDQISLRNSNGVLIPVIQSFDESKTILKLEPYYELPALDTLTIYVNVKVFKDGAEIDSEEREQSFVTGEYSKTIPLNNIASSYPIHGQYNYHKSQNAFGNNLNLGFIQLKVGQPQLLHNPPEGKAFKMRIARRDQFGLAPASYYSVVVSPSGDKISFALDQGVFDHDKYYQADLVLVEATSGGVANNDPPSNSSGLGFGNGDNANRGVETQLHKERPYPRPMFVNGNSRAGGVGGSNALANSNSPNYGEEPNDEEIVGLKFRVSNYNTFAQKMNAFFQEANYEVWQSSMRYIAQNFEPFDHFESNANELGEALVQVNWDPNYQPGTWFGNINNNFYSNIPTEGIGELRTNGVSEIPNWAGEISSTATPGVLSIAVPDFQKYRELKGSSYTSQLWIEPFNVVREDMSKVKNEIYTVAASHYADCTPPWSGGQCNLEWWEVWANHITDPWLKQFYNDELGLDWKINPGNYKATIQFSAPGVTPFNHTQIFVKPQN